MVQIRILVLIELVKTEFVWSLNHQFVCDKSVNGDCSIDLRNRLRRVRVIVPQTDNDSSQNNSVHSIKTKCADQKSGYTREVHCSRGPFVNVRPKGSSSPNTIKRGATNFISLRPFVAEPSEFAIRFDAIRASYPFEPADFLTANQLGVQQWYQRDLPAGNVLPERPYAPLRRPRYLLHNPEPRLRFLPAPARLNRGRSLVLSRVLRPYFIGPLSLFHSFVRSYEYPVQGNAPTIDGEK